MTYFFMNKSNETYDKSPLKKRLDALVYRINLKSSTCITNSWEEKYLSSSRT